MSGEAPVQKKSGWKQYLLSFFLVTVILVGKQYGDEILSLIPAKSHSVAVEAEATSDEFPEYGYSLRFPVFTTADARVQEALNGIADEIRTKANAAVASMEEQAKDDAAQSKLFDYDFRPHHYSVDFEVKYNRDNILSLTTLEYFYTGGAHGMTIQNGYNRDLKSGKILAISDLFKDVRTAKVILVYGMSERIKNDPDDMYFPDAAARVGVTDDQQYYFTNGGIVLHYGQYDLAPYVAGFSEFFFGPEELGRTLKPAIRRSLERSLVPD